MYLLLQADSKGHLLQKQNTLFIFFWQYKRETLKTTKYVELVIVADNREVRNLKSGETWVAQFGCHGIATNVLQTAT